MSEVLGRHPHAFYLHVSGVTSRKMLLWHQDPYGYSDSVRMIQSLWWWLDGFWEGHLLLLLLFN